MSRTKQRRGGRRRRVVSPAQLPLPFPVIVYCELCGRAGARKVSSRESGLHLWAVLCSARRCMRALEREGSFRRVEARKDAAARAKLATQLERERVQAERRRRELAANWRAMQTTAAVEARRNGGWVPVHCMGLVAYRGRVFKAATFDRRTADATIDALPSDL